MNIFVCIKQVPDTETKIQLNADQSGISTDSIKWVVNPYDEFAIEEALKLKASTGAEKVYAVSMGPQKRVQDSLRIALAMGCDEGIIIDSEDTSCDSLNSAKAIKAAIEKVGGMGMVLTGKSSIDDNSQTFTQQIAALFEVPHVNAVTAVQFEDGKYKVEREVEGGAKEIYEVSGAFVLGANKGLNNPRYPSLPGIMKAKKKPVQVFSLNDLGVDFSTGLEFTDYKMPDEKPPTQVLEGEIPAQVDQLVDLLKNTAKVL